jgi:hypothetical protein
MRGLFVTVNSGSGTQRNQATAGDTVYLTARVYNYSLTAMPAGTTVLVRFYRQAWDTSTNAAAADAVLISEYENPTAIPPFNSSVDPDDPNWQLVTTTFDTSDLADTYWVFWVVVWMEDADGNLIQEVPCHGLGETPGTLTSVGDVVLETSATTSACGSSVSYSNNVGFYNSVFYVQPSGTTPTGAAANGYRRLRSQPNQTTNAEFLVRASNGNPQLHERVVLTVELSGTTDTDDGTTLAFFDNGKLIDYETLPHIRVGDIYRTSIPYRPNAVGAHTIEVKARHLSAKALTTIVVPAGSTGIQCDDGCAIGSGQKHGSPFTMLLLPAVLFLVRRASDRLTRRWGMAARASRVPSVGRDPRV